MKKMNSNSDIRINQKYLFAFNQYNNIGYNSVSNGIFEGVKKIQIKDIISLPSSDEELVNQYVSDYTKQQYFFAPVYVLKRGENYYAEGNVEILEAAKVIGLERVFCKYGTKEDAENDNQYREIGTIINFNNEFIGKVNKSTVERIWLINQDGEIRKIKLYFHLKNNSLEILNNHPIGKNKNHLMTDVERAMKEYNEQNTEKYVLANYYIIKKENLVVEFVGIKNYRDTTKLIFYVNNSNLDNYKPLLKEVTLDGKTVVNQAFLVGEEPRKVIEIEVPKIDNNNKHLFSFTVIVNEYIKSDKLIVKFNFRTNLIQVNKKLEAKTLEAKKTEAKTLETKILPSSAKKLNVIDSRSFVIRSNNYNECVGHNVESVNAVIDIFDGREVKPVNVQAYYCNKCGIYYLKEQDYYRINRLGKAICQILSMDDYKKIKKNIGNKLNPESILKRFGYSVSQENHLSEKQRRAILEVIIEKNVLTKKETIEYLRFFIRYHPHMPKAIEKWQSDISYLNGYNKGNPRYIKISKIIL